MKFNHYKLTVNMLLILLFLWLSLSFTEKSVDFWKKYVNPNSNKIIYTAVIPKSDERLSTEDMFYSCRASAARLVEDTISRTLSIPYNEFGPHYQSMQVVSQAFDKFHKCEVLLAATFVNDENKQKIKPAY